MPATLLSFLELFYIFGPWIWLGYVVESIPVWVIIPWAMRGIHPKILLSSPLNSMILTVWRYAGRKCAALTFIAELTKIGIVIICVVWYTANNMYMFFIPRAYVYYAFILGCVMGNVWAFSLRFKGGKAVFFTLTAVLFSVHCLRFIPEVCLGYIIGSIPFGVIIPRILGKPDPRTVASGNPGTTNVYRAAGLFCAICVAVADILKGALPVWFMLTHFGDMRGAIMAVSCVAGAVWSCFLKGKGGKGVATASGALLPFMPLWIVAAMIVWVVITKCTKYAILASCAAILIVMLGSWMTHPITINLPLSWVLSAIIVFKHKQNFVRFFQGQENKVERKD